MRSTSGCSQAVSSIFEQLFADLPERISHAPGRVNLVGEHTDHNRGLALPFALTLRTHVAARRRSDGLVRVHSAQMQETVTHALSEARAVRGWASYVVGTVAVLDPTVGFDIVVDSQVPVGAGLSSSAALTVATALAVAADCDPAVLFEASVRAENDYAGAPTGGLDQTVALHAREGTALLLDFAADVDRRVVRHVSSTLTGHEWWIIDTGVEHDLADGGYARRRAECADAARALGVADLSAASVAAVRSLQQRDELLAARARHVITENDRVGRVVAALEADDAVALGSAITASHRSLRDDFEVSCPPVDETVATLLEAGAVGARMVGGGFGGSVLALLPSAQVDAAISTVVALHHARGRRGIAPFMAGSGAGGAAVCG